MTEILSDRGFTYTGNGPEVIDLSYDKQKTKERIISLGIPVPEGAVLTPEEAGSWTLFPSIVKPSREHCSLTITEKSVVFDTNSLREQILLVNKELNQPAMVEDFIDGREFHVSVWNNNPPEILPVAEMDFSAFTEPGRGSALMIPSSFPAQSIMRRLKRLSPLPWTGICQDVSGRRYWLHGRVLAAMITPGSISDCVMVFSICLMLIQTMTSALIQASPWQRRRTIIPTAGW